MRAATPAEEQKPSNEDESAESNASKIEGRINMAHKKRLWDNGFRMSVLRGLPDWLRRYGAYGLEFVENEQAELPLRLLQEARARLENIAKKKGETVTEEYDDTWSNSRIWLKAWARCVSTRWLSRWTSAGTR